jgi:hypothetical protein
MGYKKIETSFYSIYYNEVILIISANLFKKLSRL